MDRVDKTQPKPTFDQRNPRGREAIADEGDSGQDLPPEEPEGDIRSMLTTMEKGLQNSLSVLGTKMETLSYRMDRMSERLNEQAERIDMAESHITEVEESQTTLDMDHKPLGKVIQVLQDKAEDPAQQPANNGPAKVDINWQHKADILESKFLLTRDNHTNLVIRIIHGAVGFTYLTFNEGETVPIAYKSNLYTSAEIRFSTVENVLTAVQMANLKERTLSQGKRMLVVTPYPALEAVTKASVPNSKALHPRWIQWAASLMSPDVTFIFDASLQSQEFLQYEFVHPAPLTMRPLEDFHCIIYTDGSAQVAHGSKHAYVSACTIVVGAMVNDEFKSRVVHTQTLGDCNAQLSELRALMLALEYADPSVTTLIVSDSYYCVQSYNENLFFWIQNDFRDSKVSTIKHKMIWVRVAELKEHLPLVFVIHTLGHQRMGVHAVGNSLADEAAKSAVSAYLVAAVTRSKSKIDDDISAAVAATEKGSKYPKGFPSKYSYHLSPDEVPYVKIPDVGILVYRPPGPRVSFPSELLTILEPYFGKPAFTILGDFNFHLDVADSKDTISLVDSLVACDLIQLVKCSTHKAGHILDGVFSNDVRLSTGPPLPLVWTDHLAVPLELSLPALCPTNMEAVPYTLKRNFRKISDETLAPFISALESLSSKDAAVGAQELMDKP
ncbi:uncharacterized protein LOC144762754 [Lissotriton helveticus]